MKPSEHTKLTQEIHYALLGIAGTEDKGLYGDVKEMRKDIKQINGRVTIVETLQKERNRPSKKVVGGGIVGAIGVIVALIKSFLN